jgi:hypothetical protein
LKVSSGRRQKLMAEKVKWNKEDKGVAERPLYASEGLAPIL